MGVPGGIERGETGSDDPDSWDFAVDIMAPETLSPGVLEKLSRGDHYGSNFSRMILPDGAEATQADVLAADQAIAILENRAGAVPPGARNRTRLEPDAPFFLAVGFVRPHVPLIAAERHFSRYPDEAMRPLLSDHGYNLGEHTAWQKSSLWEESVRVPLIVSVPGMVRAGATSDAVVELIDLYPTLAELAGLDDEIPSILQGESLLPLLDAPAETDPDAVAYTVTHSGGASLRTTRWRYNRWGEDAEGRNEELYDHLADPGELRNLARDPAYAAVLDEVRARFERARRDARAAAPAE